MPFTVTFNALTKTCVPSYDSVFTTILCDHHSKSVYAHNECDPYSDFVYPQNESVGHLQ